MSSKADPAPKRWWSLTRSGRARHARQRVLAGRQPITADDVTRLTLRDPRAGRWLEEMRRAQSEGA